MGVLGESSRLFAKRGLALTSTFCDRIWSVSYYFFTVVADL